MSTTPAALRARGSLPTVNHWESNKPIYLAETLPSPWIMNALIKHSRNEQAYDKLLKMKVVSTTYEIVRTV